MRVVLSKTRARKALADGELKPLKLTLNVTSSDPKALRGIKEGKKLYIYVGDKGDLQPLAGLFADDLDSSVYQFPDDRVFRDKADYLFSISSGTNLSPLRGTRIRPTYLEVTKASDKGIQGLLHNAYDPRLAHLSAAESTDFGEGSFKLEDMVGLYDGSYFHLKLSPMAEELEKIVREQRELFHQHAEDESDTNIKRKLDTTANLLKPHAYEIYKIEDDIVYFITSSGKWHAINIAGHRKLDLWDKARIWKALDKFPLHADNARQAREQLHKRPMSERFDLAKLLPLMANEAVKDKEADQAALDKIIKTSASVKPSDGLEPIPGLKEGVEFPPHQAYMVAGLKNRDRLPVDADPGAGKTLTIIADILNQMHLGKLKRPLVITKDDLLAEFAEETRKFSDLNPWVINTESIKKWKEGKLDSFLADANSAPHNTIFITSFPWLAQDKNFIENGQIEDKKYKKIKTFPRSHRLLKALGIDGVYVDEVHSLKNDSDFTQATSVFSKLPIVKGFTGTLMPGNLIDALGPLGFIHSAVLGTADEFVEEYSPSKSINSYHDDAPKNIRARLKEFGMPEVRSTKWSFLMPKVHRQYHYAKFNATQQKAYESLLQNTLEEIEKDPKLKRLFEKFRLNLEEGEQVIHPSILARFSPLEVFLNAPADAKDYLKALLQDEDAISPKMPIINDIIAKHLADPNNGKILVFTQYKDAAKGIFDNLKPNLKEQAAYYHGGMVDVLNRFKNPDSDLKILVGVDNTLRTGHNLQSANCVIHADTLWLYGNRRQREARAARLKQTKEVHIHHVLVESSHELLKNARVLSQEHLIAKANSDFEDKAQLPHVEMTLNGMKTFRSKEKLTPFIERQKALAEFEVKQGEKDKETFGTRLMQPHRYEQLKEGKKLAVVPSVDNFQGNLNDASFAIEEELDKLPGEVEAPKLLSFNLQNWDDNWFLTCFRSADPQGFVRRLGFLLQPQYLYLEVPSKGGVSSVIKDIEDAGIEILNKEDLEQGIAKARMLQTGHRGILRELEQKGRRSVAVTADVSYQVGFHFASIDGFPFVMTDNVRLGSKESQILKKLGFREGISFWYFPITRSKLVNFLRRLQHAYHGVKIAEWQNFKEVANRIFRSDLSDFDDLGETK